ncbi:MAG: helix-turn-helix domain-containing protein [archaeon]|nr:helix-turn-helix domain-containing protein [archaeon]
MRDIKSFLNAAVAGAAATFDSGLSSQCILGLTNYGLTSNQAKVYLLLLCEGQAIPVREIANALNLHRVDVYRKLHELEELGLVEAYLDSPKKYSSLDPHFAISILINRMERRLSFLKKNGRQLERALNKYAATHHYSIPSIKDGDDTSYKLVIGREKYYKEILRLVHKSKKEILRIISSNGVNRTFLPIYGLYPEYKLAKQRGVSIRMITEVTTSNYSNAKRLSKVLELRHLDDVHLRFVVLDRSITMLSARFDEGSMSAKTSADNYLLFRDIRFSESMRFFFEHLWTIASPWNDVEQRISPQALCR